MPEQPSCSVISQSLNLENSVLTPLNLASRMICCSRDIVTLRLYGKLTLVWSITSVEEG